MHELETFVGFICYMWWEVFFCSTVKGALSVLFNYTDFGILMNPLKILPTEEKCASPLSIANVRPNS